MPVEKRSHDGIKSQGSLTGAPYLAKIVSHLDSTFQGSLEVSLLRDSGNQIAEDTQTYIVRYASPFYGVTNYDFSGKNVTYDDAQLSYGFWAMPPDVGVTGLVIFIDGNPDLGYWVACVQDKFQNHMIPSIGGTKNYKADEDYEQGEHPLPVVEHNRKANELDKNLEIDKIPRAVHPFAKRIKEQGLIRDEFRGTSTSTGRRDVPNMVFGISTPGPLDRKGKKKFIGKRQNLTPTPVPVQRLGGTQFVFDDGDDRYYRERPASNGPPTYLKWIPDQLGNVDIPYNEHVRLRTRTGHQILLHNSEDLIYIANSKGTAWIEFTSDGKIDVFAADSISLRTRGDFNFRADRDINLEAGRNVNIKANSELQVEVALNYNLIVGENQKILIRGANDQTVLKGHTQRVAENYNLNVGGYIRETSAGTNETLAGGDIFETAPNIHMNGPAASNAAVATRPTELKLHKLPEILTPSANEDPVDLVTILRRAPTFEPWPHHENLDPISYKPGKTDRDSQGRNEGETSDLRSPPSDWKKYKKPSDNPF